MVLDSSGRVGIGTTNPGTPLDVSGLIRANDSASDGYAGLVIATDSATRGYIGTAYLLNGGSETDIGYRVESGNNHIWMTGATERARIDSSGRLLVGTSSGRAVGFTSLQAPVQVETTTAAAYTAVNNTNDANGCYVSIAKTRGTSAGAVTAVQNNDELGAIRISGSDGTGFVVGAQIIAAVDGTPGTNDLPARLMFSTTADGASSPTERMRITSTGQVRLAGAGITFNGDTATANELDDYEEGTWTPILADAETGGNTAASYAANQGTYTKIGNLVRVRCNITFPVTTGMTGGNQAFIRGLPFTTNSTYQAEGAVYLRDITFPGGRTFASVWVNTGKTVAQIAIQGSGISESYMLVSEIASGTALTNFTLTYTV
jgi:hypothetical protein